MSVISLNEAGFAAQIAALSAAGEGIPADGQATSSGSTDLPTCEKYIAQQEKIAQLLNLYKSLLQKDANDLTNMKTELCQLDTDLSNEFTK